MHQLTLNLKLNINIACLHRLSANLRPGCWLLYELRKADAATDWLSCVYLIVVPLYARLHQWSNSSCML